MRLFRALALIALIVAIHADIWGAASVQSLVGNRAVLFPLAAMLVVSIAVHEALHLAGYVWIGGAPYSAVHVEWRGAAMVARCDVALSARSYRVAVALPGLVLGLLPAIVCLASGTAWLTVYGAVMLGAALGDAGVLWTLRRFAPGEKVLDSSRRR
jgi:hypothetical protein